MSEIPLNEVVYFDVITSDPTDSSATDADSTPTFAVYEEATDTDIGVGGNFTKRTSLTGNYRGSFTASAANGFEVGKFYSIIATAVVGGVTGKAVVKNFRCIAAEGIAGYQKTDVHAMKGDAQSATDLKDFADTGYDPSTHKVQGVVLTDTLTTYTGNTPQTGDSYARLGAPAGASVSADVAAVKSQTAAIETDTQDLQTQVGTAGAGLSAVPWNAAWDAEVQSEVVDGLTSYGASTSTEISSLQTHGDANWSTAAGFSTHSAADVVSAMQSVADDFKADISGLATAADVAAVKAQTAAIETDTQDLQTQVGTAGAGLTAVPWNAAWGAEVHSEVVDGLTSYGASTSTEISSLATYGDAHWATAAGFSTHSAADVVSAMQSVADDFKADISGLATAADIPSAETNALAVRTELSTELSRIDAQISTRLASSGYTAPDNSSILQIKNKTDNLPLSPAATSDITTANQILTTQMTESYAVAGEAPTLAQAIFLTMQRLSEFSIAGTNITVKKLDGSSTAAVLQMDDATAPTSSTRTS